MDGLKTTLGRDLWSMMIGEKLGGGMSREVYEFKPDPKYVVKVEGYAGNFQNIKEWLVWNEIQFTPFAKHFAPCKAISDNGIYLLQERVHFPELKAYPDRVPSFFTDLKTENYGFIGGRLVCCDYGSTIISQGFNNRTRKADWISE